MTQSNLHRHLGVLQSTITYLSHTITATYHLMAINLLIGLDSLHTIQLQPKRCYTLVKFIYSSQLWNPYSTKDIVMLERIQRRATKFILNDVHY